MVLFKNISSFSDQENSNKFRGTAKSYIEKYYPYLKSPKDIKVTIKSGSYNSEKQIVKKIDNKRNMFWIVFIKHQYMKKSIR
jgi:hypothetical protein